MNKWEKIKFMEAGGLLLRTGRDKNGKYLIKVKSSIRDWSILRRLDTAEERESLMSSFLANTSKYILDEEY